MLADRVRMGSGGKKDMVLYDSGNIYTEYGRTKNYSTSFVVGTITFNSDHFHIYTASLTGAHTIRSAVGFKLPPNLSTDAKILVKYFDCDAFQVALISSIDILNSRNSLYIGDMKAFPGLYSGTDEITITIGDTTGYEVVGVVATAFDITRNNSFEKLEVIR